MESIPEVQTSAAPPQTAPRRIAPLWHTLLLIAIIGIFSAAGSQSQHPAAKHGLALQYLLTMGFEWLLFGFTLWSIKKGGVVTFREVVGGRWEKAEDFLLDLAIAAGFWMVSVLVLGGLGLMFGLGKGAGLEEARKSLGFLVPRSHLEIALWFGVSATAGFCEEFIFRGYVQRQFTALSGQIIVGMVVSAVTFGLAHGYEGSKRMLLIAVYGLLFSVLTWLRGSTRPGMIAHFWHDSFTGMVLRVLFK